MKDRDIENRLATYVQQTTPDVLDSVLQQCDEQEGRVLPMSSIQKINHHPKKRTWRIALSAAAAVFILATARKNTLRHSTQHGRGCYLRWNGSKGRGPGYRPQRPDRLHA